MFETELIINEIYVLNNVMHFSIAVSCPYDSTVTSPKAKVVFECDGKTRRFPLKMNSYFRQKRTDKCTTVFSYNIWIDYIFFNMKSDSPIKATLEFYYGDNEIKNLPFLLTPNSAQDDVIKTVDKKHIVKQRTDGMGKFDSEDIPIVSKRDRFYTTSFDFDNNTIILTKNPTYRKRRKSVIIVPILRFIMFLLRLAVTVCLIPYFILDGIMAGLEITPRRKTKHIDGVLKNILVQIKVNISSMIKTSFKRDKVVENMRKPFIWICNVYYKMLCKKPVVENRITFMSGRRDELTGNPKFVYDLIKDNKDVDFQFFMFSDPNGHNKPKNLLKFLKLYSSSKVVIIDDYFRLTNIVQKRDETKLFQLWHACGAFKTFGYSRLGKRGGPKQTDSNHRMYDYAIVSSQEIAKHYAEGFGLDDECVIATGIPRTDIFMDSDYAKRVKEEFYAKRPHLKDKKIILYAPTFRGSGQMGAYFPTKSFNPNKLYEKIGDEYALIIKLHPFCKERYKIKDEYKDYIIDLSDEDELNDLLFVTDLLITDYSSVIFEASLLDIPMLFYSYDVQTYISSRDFYYDYEGFVPGKIVLTEKDLLKSIINKDFDYNKVDAFKHKFFDNIDGNSSQRVADAVMNALRG